VQSLCDFIIDDYGDFDCPAPVGNFKDAVVERPRLIRQLAYKFGRTRDISFEQRFLDIPRITFGLPAVYKLFSHIWKGNIRFKPEFNETEAVEFSRNLLFAMGPACYASPLQWEAWAKRAYSHWPSEGTKNPFFWYQAAEAIRHLKVAKGV